MTTFRSKRTFVGQIELGEDLYEALTRLIQKENIRLGRLQAIGATTHAVVAYYDQKARKYNPMEFPGGMEIVSCTGNISIRDGKPFVHAHIALGDAQGRIFGGHLMPGTRVFACEVFVEEYEGEELIRTQEEKTGLFLWKGNKL